MSVERRSRRLLISRRWTAEEDAKLLGWALQGMSTLLMAAKLRRTPKAVRARKEMLVPAAEDMLQKVPVSRSE